MFELVGNSIELYELYDLIEASGDEQPECLRELHLVDEVMITLELVQQLQ
jgi:hypothetical protein